MDATWPLVDSYIEVVIKTDDNITLENLINSGSLERFTIPTHPRWNLLHYIASSPTSGMQCLDLLLKKGDININSITCEGDTPLLLACKHRLQHIKFVVSRLLRHGANPNICNNNQESPILTVVKRGDLYIMNLLLLASADVNVKNCHGWTPLHEAAIFNDKLDIMKKLLTTNAKLDATDKYGLTPLWAALKHGQLDNFKELLIVAKHRGRQDLINHKLEDGTTPLIFAIQQGFSECAHSIVENGGDVNARTNDQNTAMHVAVKNGDLRCTELLLQLMELEPLISESDPKICPRPCLLPVVSVVHMAIEFKRYDCLKMLLDANFSPNSLRELDKPDIRHLDFDILKDLFFGSAVYFAVSFEDDIAVRILLNAGATPDIPYRHVMHPLMNAVVLPSPRMFDLLLEYGSNVNYCYQEESDYGNRLLLVALLNPYWNIYVPKLLHAGCDPMPLFTMVKPSTLITKLCIDRNPDRFSDANNMMRHFLVDPVFHELLQSLHNHIVDAVQNGSAHRINCPITNAAIFCNCIVPELIALQMIWLLHFVTINNSVKQFYHFFKSSKVRMSDDRKIWRDMERILDKPSSLRHICRMKIRHVMYARSGPAFRNLIKTLPLPSMIVDYISFLPNCSQE